MTKEELVLWRKARGFSQSQLAKLVGVRREAVSRWENGIHEIPQDALAKMEAATPEGQRVKVQALPAEKPYARWRPYPWGNRDYVKQEVERAKPGTKVWRLELVHLDAVWEHMVAYGKVGHFVFGEPYGLTLPAEAFPDPNGAEEPWARAMHDSRKAELERKNAGLRNFREAMGIPEEDFGESNE